MTDMTDHNTDPGTDPNSDPGTRAGRPPLLHAEDRDDLQQRWVAVEEWFADDPGDAVRRADALIDDVIERIRSTLSERRGHLRDRFEALDDATTEQLRGTLHDYEQLFAQLTGFTAPAGWHDDAHGGRPTAHGRARFPRADEAPHEQR